MAISIRASEKKVTWDFRWNSHRILVKYEESEQKCFWSCSDLFHEEQLDSYIRNPGVLYMYYTCTLYMYVKLYTILNKFFFFF